MSTPCANNIIVGSQGISNFFLGRREEERAILSTFSLLKRVMANLFHIKWIGWLCSQVIVLRMLELEGSLKSRDLSLDQLSPGECFRICQIKISKDENKFSGHPNKQSWHKGHPGEP